MRNFAKALGNINFKKLNQYEKHCFKQNGFPEDIEVY